MTTRARRLSRTTRRLTGLAVLVAVVAVPGVADASVATRTGTQISITAASGEANDIRFTVDCCLYNAKITDTAGITAAGECTQVSATEVDCGDALVLMRGRRRDAAQEQEGHVQALRSAASVSRGRPYRMTSWPFIPGCRLQWKP